ncbi:hypothetical protein Tco_1313315 [Tanacetum coccineum]
MSIIRDRMKGTLSLSREKYIGKVLEKFNLNVKMLDVNLLENNLSSVRNKRPRLRLLDKEWLRFTYAMTVNKVMYIIYSSCNGVLSRFISNTGREHQEVVKWLLRYLKETLKATFCFNRKKDTVYRKSPSTMLVYNGFETESSEVISLRRSRCRTLLTHRLPPHWAETRTWD